MPRLLGFTIFLGLLIAAVGGLQRYLWTRLIRDPMWGEALTSTGTIAAIALGLLVILAIPLSRILPRRLAQLVAGIAFVWMGVGSLVIVGVAAAELLLLVLPGPDAGPASARQLATLGLSLGGALSLVGLFGGLSTPKLRQVEIELPGLAPALAGFTIVQLSDVHIGLTIGRRFLERVVRRVNEARPDAVVITGDLIDGSVDELRDHVAPLAGLVSKHGTFFVTGNHEYYSGADEWLTFLTSLGIRVLRNERVVLGEGAGAIALVGVDDASAFGRGHGLDLARALEGRDPAQPVVLLAHQPKIFPAAARAGVALQLSGHTHGGQIFPFSLIVRLVQPYLAGLHERGDAKLYVSRGTGYWGPPVRLFAPAEVTKLVLRPPSSPNA